MKELLALLTQAAAAFRASITSTMSAVPAAEQHEANPEVAVALRLIRTCASNLIEGSKQQETELAGKIGDLVVNAEKTAVENAIAAGLASGELVRKADHEAKISAAVDGAKKTATDEATQQFEARIKASERRATLLKDVPTAVAEAVPNEVLLADNAPASVETIKTRIKALAAIGVTAENSAAFVAEAANLPCDATGEAAFKAKLAPLEAQRSAITRNGPPNPALSATTKSADGNRRFL